MSGENRPFKFLSEAILVNHLVLVSFESLEGADALRSQIPHHTYNGYRTTWMEFQKLFQANQADKAWHRFNELHDTLDRFNKRFSLPRGWNFNEPYLEGRFGKRTVARKQTPSQKMIDTLA
jgi:hypothetical protein